MTNSGPLTKMDEYPRHQIGGTFDSVQSDSVHWNDGFYFTLGDEATGATLFAAIRLYPNTDVIDGFACVTFDGRQHNMRVSRRLRPRIDDISVGPLSLTIIEPLQTLQLECADNEYGITFDLMWEGLHEPYLEDRIVRYAGGRKVYDRTNFDQCCAVTGTISVKGHTFNVNADTWVGVRDHSWGMGRTGGAVSNAIAPDNSRDPRRGFAMRQWTMVRMPDRVMFWQFHLQADGSFDPLEAVVIPLDPSQPHWSYVDAEASAVRAQGLPRADAAHINLTRPDGKVDRFELTSVSSPVYLQGGGYHDGFTDRLGRGVYRGEDFHEGEVWDVTHPINVGDPSGWFRQRPDAWAEQFATCVNLDDPTDRGFGHLECVLAP
jgi:hypothetical protein